jgi:hypothetical protein
MTAVQVPRAARVLRVPAIDEGLAVHAEDYLLQQGIEVNGRDGRFVLVPAGWSAIFVWDLAELMQEHDYADDAEIAAWATDVTSAAP